MSLKVYLSGSTQENNIGVVSYGTEEFRMQSLSDKVVWWIIQGRGDILCYRNYGSMTLGQTIANSNEINPDIHVALHSNAGGGAGTECYYSNYPVESANGKRLAQLIYDAVAPITISNDRGCQPDTNLYSTGLAETRDTTAKACLLEVMFHDNIVDVEDYLSNNKDNAIALAIAKAIYAYFGIEYYIAPIEKTEKEKVIEYIDGQNGWDILYRMFNL
jgi:N-acetylmuramoyl-L-alanine amidase